MCHVAVVDHCVMVLRAFLTCVCLALKLPIQYSPGHDAQMWFGSSRGVLFPLS